MNEERQKSKEAGGICGHESEPESNAAMTAIHNDYRWTPACQRAFLEELACTGSVLRATKHVQKSPRSAYDLRFRRDGAALRLGWDAAILVSRAMLHDMLIDRAVNGYEEITVKNDDGSIMRGKFDNRLGFNLVQRLDRIAERQACANSHDGRVQMVVQDFEAFLDLIEKGGKGSEAALFFAGRDPEVNGEASVEEGRAIDCELDRISATEEKVAEFMDEDPEVAAQRLSIWYDEEIECWKTDFPIPDGADAEYIEETGFFGDEDYERGLTEAEVAAHLAALTRERKPWIDAAAAARDAWFGEKLAA